MRFVRITLALAAAATLAIAAAAAGNGVKSGTIKLKADQATFEGFADMSIAVEPKGDAKSIDGGFAFQADAGDISPDVGFQGLIAGGGALKFSRSTDGAKVKFKNLQVVIHKQKADLGGTVKGVFVKLAKVSDYAIAGTDTSFVLKNGDAVLSRVGANVLSEAFDFPFHRGIPLGELKIKATITKHQVEE